MGVCYTVACKDCKVWANVGKLRAFICETETALDVLSESIETCPRYAAMLISFLKEHECHSVVFAQEELSEVYELSFEEDDKFWPDDDTDIV